jgi:raffinose/stachyose/melibiose transport system permease protein
MNKKLLKRSYPELLLIPSFILFVLFIMGPNIASFYLSFTNWNAYSDVIKFTGTANFKDIFSSTYGIGGVILNTIIFAVFSMIFKIIFGLILAVSLNEGIRSKDALRAIFFLPLTLATVLVGIVFTEMYQPDGLINSCLSVIGLGSLSQNWITNTHLAIWSCAVVEIWRASGFAMAVFLAALQSVPKEIYEAVNVDGATAWQKFHYITIPYLHQAIVINVILGLISGLKVFDIVYLVTNGGPGQASEVLNVTVLNDFSKGLYGHSTALGMILFLFITILYLGVNFILSKFEVDVS